MAEVMAFRLAGHGLVVRGGDLVAAAGRCGLQNTPLGSAGLALAARATDAIGVDAALDEDRSLRDEAERVAAQRGCSLGATTRR